MGRSAWERLSRFEHCKDILGCVAMSQKLNRISSSSSSIMLTPFLLPPSSFLLLLHLSSFSPSSSPSLPLSPRPPFLLLLSFSSSPPLSTSLFLPPSLLLPHFYLNPPPFSSSILLPPCPLPLYILERSFTFTRMTVLYFISLRFPKKKQNNPRKVHHLLSTGHSTHHHQL